MARPTKYGQDILDKTRDYIQDYEKHEHAIPSIAGLACVLGVGRRTLHDWAVDENKEEFSHILEELLAKQEQVLMSKGLKGDFNSAITKLALGKHGYHEKQEVGGIDGEDLVMKVTYV